MRELKSEYKSVELLSVRVGLEYVLHQRVNLVARCLDLCIKGLQLLAFFLKLNQFVGLVQYSSDSLFCDHLCYEILSLILFDS